MKYGFFPGCAYHTAAGYRQSLEAVCSRLGIELNEIPDWTCCGATVFFSIDKFKALALAGRIFALARKSGFDEIVTGCNACYTTLRKAACIFSEDKETLDSINERLARQELKADGDMKIRHFLEILVDDVPEDVWQGNAFDMRVAAYYGCQLTRPWADLDDSERPAILERFIERIGFLPVEHSAKTLCCGASHAVPYAKACLPMISRIVNGIRDKEAEIVTTICPMCQFNLDAGMKNGKALPSIPVTFFTQLAGLSLGIDPSALGLDKLLVPFKQINKMYYKKHHET